MSTSCLKSMCLERVSQSSRWKAGSKADAANTVTTCSTHKVLSMFRLPITMRHQTQVWITKFSSKYHSEKWQEGWSKLVTHARIHLCHHHRLRISRNQIPLFLLASQTARSVYPSTWIRKAWLWSKFQESSWPLSMFLVTCHKLLTQSQLSSWDESIARPQMLSTKT